MLLLACRIGSGQDWARLEQPECRLAKYTSALSNSEFDTICFLNPRRQGLAIPEVDPHACVARFAAQHAIDFF